MKLNEMRELKPEDFTSEIEARKKELLELRFQSSITRSVQPHRIRQLRREVAQLNTVRREQLAQEQVQGESK